MNKLDETIKENFYDDHENCDDSCGKKADYTEFKNDLHQLILEVIETKDLHTDSASCDKLRQEQRQKLSDLFGKETK